jgi:hypothetical protein
MTETTQPAREIGEKKSRGLGTQGSLKLQTSSFRETSKLKTEKRTQLEIGAWSLGLP